MNHERLIFCALALTALASCSSSSDTNRASQTDDPVVTPINQIQGSGSSSPKDNAAVTISGMVSGDFQDNDADLSSNLGGFYVQVLSAYSDPATSEGIFVFDS